jgi:aminobenzoyl-glutamate utilization protein B
VELCDMSDANKSDAVLELNRRSMLLASAAAVAATSVAGAAPAAAAEAPAAVLASTKKAADAVARVREPILRISQDVWRTAELSLHEVKSVQIHIRELEAAGFTITSRGTSGIPTAFVAEWGQGSGGPKIGLLPEYDALPGLGNAAVAELAPSADGNTVGHGCGHTMLGAGCTGAAFALKQMMQDAGVPGLVRVYGCAAEETEGAKVYTARDGLFDDLDAALAWHPAPVAAAGGVMSAAIRLAKVEFLGRTAHAGMSPWLGRSALDALELFAHGINNMREHIEPTARVHYIFESTGVAVNVVPEPASAFIAFREVDIPRVEALAQWAREIADGAALMTQTTAKFDVYIGLAPLIPNDALAARLLAHINVVGVDHWTDDEQQFAKQCQKTFGVAEAGLATAALPLLPDTPVGGGTDVGDVSWHAPTGVFAWPTLPLGIGLHTWPVTACGGMSIGDKASLASATILAATGFDLMTDPALLKAAKENFTHRIAGRVYVNALAPDRKQPLTLPAYLTKSAADELFTDIAS